MKRHKKRGKYSLLSAQKKKDQWERCFLAGVSKISFLAAKALGEEGKSKYTH